MASPSVAARYDPAEFHSTARAAGSAGLYAAAQADDWGGGRRAEPSAKDSRRRQREDWGCTERRVRVIRTTDAGGAGEWVDRQCAAERVGHRAVGAGSCAEKAGRVDGGAGRPSDADVTSDFDPSRDAAYGLSGRTDRGSGPRYCATDPRGEPEWSLGVTADDSGHSRSGRGDDPSRKRTRHETVSDGGELQFLVG